MQSHILLLDHDPLLVKVIGVLLDDRGYSAAALTDPRGIDAALEDGGIDLVLIGSKLPGVDGLALCARLARERPTIPIVLLSDRSTPADKVAGLEAGADDYIVKPFDPAELLARVQAVLRRSQRAERHIYGMAIRVGNATLDLASMRFSTPQRPPVALTPMEMKLLECLMRNANASVSREVLLERVWGYEYEGITGRVDVLIRRLRQKIEAEPELPVHLETVRGIGYRFRDASTAHCAPSRGDAWAAAGD